MHSEFIQKLTSIVETNLANEKFGPEELAKEAGLSHSSLHRKLKIISNQSISQFIREIRLKKAKELLQNEELTIAEISYQVGFGSPSYFSKCFHEYFGDTPGELRNKELENELVEIQVEPLTQKRKKAKILVVLIVVVLSSYFLIYQITKSKSLVTNEKSIAVLPFKNLSNNDEYQYFADGITLDIIHRLNQIRTIKIVSWMSIIQTDDDNETIQKIAKKHKIDYILSGSVQKFGQNVKITYRLIDVVQSRYVLSNEFEKEYKNIFAIQSNIAKEVANELSAILSQNEIERIEKVPTKNLEAYNLYLKGRFLWNKRTEDGLKKSIKSFNSAIELDPDYALAWTGLADANYILAGWGLHTSKKEGEEKAKSYVKKALEIDNNLAEAHTTLGFIHCYTDWNWDEAEKELLTAIKLNPNYAFAHQIYAQLLDIKGDAKKARTEIDIAINLEPLSTIMHYISATLYYNDENFNKSIMELEEILSLQEDFGVNWWLFKNYYRQGKGDLAMNEIQKIFLQNPIINEYADSVQIVYAKSGLSGVVDWIIKIDKEIDLNRTEIFEVELYAIGGQKVEAISILERYFETNTGGDELLRLINNLDYKTLRSETRFERIIEKLGLK